MKPLIIILLLLFAISIFYYGIKAIGKHVIQKDYEEDFKKLEMAVNDSLVNHVNYKTINGMFYEISQYKCRDKERIDVLLRQFRRKFLMPEDEIF